MKVGIIGCGRIAQERHIPEYDANINVELAGYYDFHFDRACALANQYGGRAFETLEELLEDKNIDAVSVCVANSAHAEVSIKALNAGKHVLCEKPMAVTLKECIDMVEAAEKNGKKLMIGHNQRFAKAHVRAKELIAQGAIGKVLTFRTTFGHEGPEAGCASRGANNWFFDKKRAGIGAMADLGVHKTDLIQYLLDTRIVETIAKITTLDKRDPEGNLIGVDDNAICIYTLENGVVGTMTASWTYYGEDDDSTCIYGTKGIMKIYEDPRYAISISTKEGEKSFYDIDQNQGKSGIIDAFVEAVMEDKRPQIDGKDVLNAMKAVFASVESGEKNMPVRIR